jgi:hypoxanthine-guanine phosphoribosyltransferase
MQHFHCQYQPDLIRKTKYTRSLKFLKKEDRLTTLKDAYLFTGNSDYTSNTFLIIDDILTTGSTLNSIEDAIRRGTDNTDINYYTLARSDYAADLNKEIELKGESYSWQPRSGWAVSDLQEVYNELDMLKSRIDSDFSFHALKRNSSLRK